VLESIEPEERELVEKAIKYHGCKELPAGLEAEALLFSRLIRDADKLDVFYVVVNNYCRYRDNPEEFLLEVELPDGPGCSSDVVEDVLRGRRIDYSRLRTLNDMKLLQLGWVYDVNFTPTLRRIKHRRFLETLADFLPQTDDTKRVRERVLGYVDSRIGSQTSKD